VKYFDLIRFNWNNLSPNLKMN